MLQSKIIVALLIICSFCKGQDVKVYPVEITRPQYGINDSLAAPIKKVYDTIKVEMLVTSTDEINNKVIKIIGYEVRQVSVEPAGWNQYGDGMTFNKTEQNYYSHVEWLDIIKQPLKNIRVWLSNKIN